MTKMKLLPVNPRDDAYICETCHKTITGDLYGLVEEKDLTGVNVGNSYHCESCMNCLARMAEALGALEGPSGPVHFKQSGSGGP